MTDATGVTHFADFKGAIVDGTGEIDDTGENWRKLVKLAVGWINL